MSTTTHVFISYSSDDKAWTSEFANALHEEFRFSVFIDYINIPTGTNWWQAICENIESCDYVLYVMTPKSIESVYCTEEIDYALALNKPILPLMLKPCTFPDKLTQKFIQHLPITDSMSIERILLRLSNSMRDIDKLIARGDFPKPTHTIRRPSEPTGNPQEIFEIAVNAAEKGDLEEALGKFKRVLEIDKVGHLKKSAEKRVKTLQLYKQIASFAEKRPTINDARELWIDYIAEFGAEFDPLGLADRFKESPLTISTLTPIKKTSTTLLTKPFEWIRIPKGPVQITYIGAVSPFHVPEFEISKYPITNAQFRLFIEASGYEEKRWWTEAGWNENQREKWISPRLWTNKKWNGDIEPVVGITWYEAVAFCNWLSEVTREKIMLPSEQQWQRAAQGGENIDYPWGGDWDKNRCNNGEVGIGKTTPVTQFEIKGDSIYGVCDMSGNVWEWCITTWESGRETIEGSQGRVLRGGSFSGFAPNLRCTNRRRSDSNYTGTGVGFRIIKSGPNG
jgi:formylglycine-generating enzyme required for sulfatase activity